MMPVLAVVAAGRRRWVLPLPLPVILLWPFVVLPLGAAAAIERLVRRDAGRGRPTVAGTALAMLWQLSGLRIDVRSARGVRVFVWLI